jgi:hypothetical protein
MSNNPTTVRSTGHVDRDMWRVDVAGYPISVRGQYARDHLEKINRQNAKMKMALHRILKMSQDPWCQEQATKALEINHG